MPVPRPNTPRPRSRRRRLVAAVLAVALLGALASGATLAALSDTTDNAANSVAAGTVTLTDSDGGSPLYSLSAREPGWRTESCVRVSYTGSVPGELRLFSDSSIGALGPYVNLTITPGTQAGSPTFPSCANFTPDAGGDLYDGTLSAFRSAHGSWGAGLVDQGPASASSWQTGDSVVYRIRVSLKDDDAAEGLSTGSHRYVFEAENE